MKIYKYYCKQCGDYFESVTNGRNFCSLSCSTSHSNIMRKGFKDIEIKCDKCGRIFTITNGYYNKHKKRGFKHLFCCRKCFSEFYKGKKSPKMSAIVKKLYEDGLLKHKFHSKCSYREDIGVYVRSTWEANYARILNYLGKTWRYEPETFRMCIDGNNTTYTPDFYIDTDDIWVEIKGYWYKNDKSKFNEFSKNHNIKLIEHDDYVKLYEMYGDKIEWEGRKL